MNMMMPNLNEKGKEITVSFMNFQNKIFDKYTCYENDMAYKLFDKKNPNMHWNLIKYTCDEKKINPFLTIKENGINIIGEPLLYDIIFIDCNIDIIKK